MWPLSIYASIHIHRVGDDDKERPESVNYDLIAKDISLNDHGNIKKLLYGLTKSIESVENVLHSYEKEKVRKEEKDERMLNSIKSQLSEIEKTLATYCEHSNCDIDASNPYEPRVSLDLLEKILIDYSKATAIDNRKMDIVNRLTTITIENNIMFCICPFESIENEIRLSICDKFEQLGKFIVYNYNLRRGKKDGRWK